MIAPGFKFTLLVFIGVLCGVTPVRAELVFTWQDCVRQAGENHPDIIAAAEALKQAEMDNVITRSVLLPQITSSGSDQRTRSAAGVETETYSYSLTGQQLVFDGLGSIADVKSQRRTLTAQGYNYAVTSSNVRLNLRNAFTAFLRAQELISLTEEIAQRRRQNLELVRLRYEGGREHQGSFLTAQADLAQAEFEAAQAVRNLSVTRRELAKEMGWEKLAPFTVKGNFSLNETDREKPDFEFLADNTPLLKELIAKKEAARFDLASARADFFPEVYLSGTVGRTGSDWPPKGEDWSAGVSVSLPIFEGGRRRAQAAKAKSQFKEAQADERSGRDSVLLTLEETWKDLQDAIDTVTVKEKFLMAAQARAKIANSQYSTGLISFDNWVIIEDNLVSAKKSFLDAQAGLLTAQARWVQAKGEVLVYVEK